MNRHALIATAALAVLCGQAMAGEVTRPTDPGKSQPNNAARSAIRSTSHAQGGSAASSVTVNEQAGGGSGSGRGREGGSLYLAAPPVNSANNCAVGGSLGGGTPRSSGLLGWLFEADDCKVDRRLGVIQSIDGNDAAREYLCRKDMDARWVARDRGHPCQIDLNRWREAGWVPKSP